MSANFIPPIPIGQFRPSSEAIASWLYEVWKYLQENPIPTVDDVTDETQQVAQTYIAQNVPPMVSQLIANLSYNDFVAGTSLPIYRASNDEIGPQDLLEAWNEGCRFALVDDESFYIMIKNDNTILLLQLLTEEQATGVISVNGQTGIVVIPNATQLTDGLMSSTDKTMLDAISTKTYITISADMLPDGVWTSAYHSLAHIGNLYLLTIGGTLATNIGVNDVLLQNLPSMAAETNTLVAAANNSAYPITANRGAVRSRGAIPSGTFIFGQMIFVAQ